MKKQLHFGMASSGAFSSPSRVVAPDICSLCAHSSSRARFSGQSRGCVFTSQMKHACSSSASFGSTPARGLGEDALVVLSVQTRLRTGSVCLLNKGIFCMVGFLTLFVVALVGIQPRRT